MKKIICDASPLISLSDNCMLGIIEKFENVEFFIPQGVKKEIVDTPLHIRRFELKAIFMEKFIKSKVLKIFDDPKIIKYGDYYTDLANKLFRYKNKNIKILQKGEAQSLGCLKTLKDKNLMVDERTTRHMIENIDLLQKYMEDRMGIGLDLNKEAKEELEEDLRDINVIRSSEILAYAYEKGLLGEKRPELLEGGLWALKFSGCSITKEEIYEYMKLLG